MAPDRAGKSTLCVAARGRVGGHCYQNLYWQIQRELLARRRRQARVCRVHASGLLPAQQQGSPKKKSFTKGTSGICCVKENSAGPCDNERAVGSSSEGGGVEAFCPACTSDMSVF